MGTLNVYVTKDYIHNTFMADSILLQHKYTDEMKIEYLFHLYLVYCKKVYFKIFLIEWVFDDFFFLKGLFLISSENFIEIRDLNYS